MRFPEETRYSMNFLKRLAIACILMATINITTGAPTETDTTASLPLMQSSSLFNHDYATIRLRYPGAYRLNFEELDRAGVPITQVVDSLRLENNGKSVPYFLNYENVGTTSSRNYIEFIGDLPRGEVTVRRAQNQENVYYLTWDKETTRPLDKYKVVFPKYDKADKNASIRCHTQLEKDLYLSYTSLPPEISDHYYWIMKTSAAPGMFPLWISFPQLSMIGELPTLTMSVVGLNDNRTTKTTHLFDVFLGKTQLGSMEFSGMQRYQWSTTVPLSLAKGNNKFLIESPEWRRQTPDSIALDWITLTWPRTLNADKQAYFSFTDDVILTGTATKPEAIQLFNLLPTTRVYSPDNSTVYMTGNKNDSTLDIPLQETTHTLFAVANKGWNSVDSIRMCKADTSLTNVNQDTRCIVIYHPKTAKSAEIYTDYRNHQGLKTQAYDITRIFDVLNHGFISDQVLKSWLRYAYEQAPNLQYICLMGDSTNDYREIQYDEREKGTEPDLAVHKILIPIRWVRNPATRHSAGYPDDNWYGAFHWSNMPDVAVGRIPVNNDEEAMAYLRKLIDYEEKRMSTNDKLLLISSVENEFQDLVRGAGTQLQDHFTTTVEMFSEADMNNICSVIDSGVQMVYYLGHGGSFVWRFGPTDYRHQKDLFTPAHIKRLNNKDHYPVIVCSSCYVTSFDNKLSLGESFLVEPDRGSVAVVGTPWKTSVSDSHDFNMHMFEAYPDLNYGRLGDIFMHAKRATKPISPSVIDYQTFTILGDPALQLVRKDDGITSTSDRFRMPDQEKQPTWTELGRLVATDFDTKVYRNRSLITTSTVTLKEWAIPADATHLRMVGRGNLENESFPLLHTYLEMKTNDGTKRSISVFEGFTDSLAPAAYYAPIPKGWAGRTVLIRLNIDNASMLFDERVFKLAYVAFVKNTDE